MASSPPGIAPQLNIVTLGVVDLRRSCRFYHDLGWQQTQDESEGITWFATSGSWLGLFGWAELAEDAGLSAMGPGSLPAFRGSTLAINLGSVEDVDAAFDVALAAGATLVKAADHTPWGGYSGYFADPDGHLWELAHNPFFPIDAEGRIDIPVREPDPA